MRVLALICFRQNSHDIFMYGVFAQELDDSNFEDSFERRINDRSFAKILTRVQDLCKRLAGHDAFQSSALSLVTPSDFAKIVQSANCEARAVCSPPSARSTKTQSPSSAAPRDEAVHLPSPGKGTRFAIMPLGTVGCRLELLAVTLFSFRYHAAWNCWL
jgi:hypothetical protein